MDCGGFQQVYRRHRTATNRLHDEEAKAVISIMCAIDHTPFESPNEPSTPLPPELKRPKYDFAPLSEGDRQKDLVTLMACRTLGEADMVVSRLRAAGIEAFLPDESLMQVIAWNLNT